MPASTNRTVRCLLAVGRVIGEPTSADIWEINREYRQVTSPSRQSTSVSSRAVVLRLWALLLLLLGLLAVAGAVGLHRMRDVTRAVDTVFRDRVVPMDQLRSVQEVYGFRLFALASGHLDGA
jgi:hypothetical protein